MPNVKMNSKSLLENLRSDIARGELGGTLLSASVTLDDEATPVDTPKMFVKNGHSITIGDAVITIASNGTLSISGGENTPLLTTINVAYNGGAQSYTVTGATGTITAIENAGWLTTSVSTNTITITPQNNNSTQTRSAIVTVYEDDEVIGTINVVQAGQSE